MSASSAAKSMTIERVLVADSSRAFRESLSQELSGLGMQVEACEERMQLRALLSSHRPDLLVTELRLEDGPTLDFLLSLRVSHPTLRIAVATCHASVATAVKCMRHGIYAYLPKPVTAGQIFEVLVQEPSAVFDSPAHVPETPMRLERAVWEYIHRAVESAGSITQAATNLGLDRRSLRRMLARGAPP